MSDEESADRHSAYDADDCGCTVQFVPCDKHLATLTSGEESVYISVRFDDKYSRFAGNKHGVNLERVQRIQLGIDSEPMEFTEVTIADMLQHMADERPFETEAFVLRALANAFRGDDDYHVLVLKQKKRGKWESPTEFEERHNREMSWLYTLGSWEHNGMKTEAAVARIAELAKVSRATVFQGVSNAEKFLENCRSFAMKDEVPDHLKNPRPSKNENG